MFQRFHDESLFSRFVKNLLTTELIPQLRTVFAGDNLIKNCSYIYNGLMIRCTSSGILDTQLTEERAKYEYCDLTVPTSGFTSKVSWYDSDTHKHLGNYLRYLRDARSIDLMRYYNCYNSTELTDVYLTTVEVDPLLCSDKVFPKPYPQLLCGQAQRRQAESTYRFGSLSGYKVVAVPIKFDTTYTIAVESHTVVSIRGIIYNNTGMVKKATGGYYSDDLEHSCTTLSNARFEEPFTYRLDLASACCTLTDEQKLELYTRQQDLYLVIQLPSNTASSIVVLEGNYTQTRAEIEVSNLGHPDFQAHEHFDSRSITVKKYPDKLSLLTYNTGVSYAFSDRLVEYLLLNVVTPLETLPTNISRVQQSLRRLSPRYRDRLTTKSAVLGIWDDAISTYIQDLVFRNQSIMEYSLDHDGYINKDVESLLSLKGVYVT